MAEYIKIYTENPNPKQISRAVKCLKEGGIVIIPTDTVYAIACDMYSWQALDRLCQLTNKKKERSNFSFLCYDLSHLSDYAKPLDNHVFKLMKRLLPGAYTFILEANSIVPKMIQKKKTVGIRVPDNLIARTLVEQLGNPILSSSLKTRQEEISEYIIDPELIFEQYKNLVDMIIDGGFGGLVPSTVISCLGNQIEVIREGKGEITI
jgi:tRNA threonylcarbamoyl adenosine modification protein (Sua5/YciO/YrdC/YwlC family)